MGSLSHAREGEPVANERASMASGLLSSDAIKSTNEGSRPGDAVIERLDDPAVAAALVTLLDNAELLSTLVLAISGVLERGDTIIESVAGGVQELKDAEFGIGVTRVSKVLEVATALEANLPSILAVLRSPIADPRTVEVVSMLGEATTEGVARARKGETRVTGAFGALRALKDPDVSRGLGVLVEIAKSLGQRIGGG
jgi:hypothetical protein